MFFKYSFIFSLIIFLSACASFAPEPDQFKVNISSMRMLDSTLMEQRFQVSLRVMNRGRKAVSIDGMSFDIELNGKDFASGVSNEKVTIPAFSEGLVTVNVTSTIFGIIRQLHGMQQNKSGPFRYEISGSIYPSASILSIPFKEQGEIDLNTSVSEPFKSEPSKSEPSKSI